MTAPSPRRVPPRACDASRVLSVLLVILAAGCSRSPAPPDPADFPGEFTGSAACRDCHLEIHERWRETLMANVLVDPRERPDIILGDFDTPHPLGDVNVRSHTFRFVSPADTERYGVPNPCTSCHTDETNEWALEELRAWPHVSPWRVAP